MTGLVGRTLGRYEIVDLIGRGGMGEVYRARDAQLDRQVAVKVLAEEAARDEQRLDRFKQEARAVARLSHPNILAIHDFGSQDGVLYAVTELLEGDDLGQRMRRRALPISKVREIGRAVAEGLAAAHARGIVHRDVKPANIFVTSTGQVKILDFGVARLREELTTPAPTRGTTTTTLTLAGQIVGTTAYMSPEQVAGHPVDSRSDIFSLGCVLYEMLTGRRAFGGANPRETMLAIASRDPAPVAELRADVPPALEAVVKRCLEKEPSERFESARDVAFALEAVTDSRRPPRAHPGPGRPRQRAAVVALSGLVVVGGLLVAATRWLPGTAELPEVKRLAVLDFTATPTSPELERLAAGLAEVVADDLTLLERASHGSLWVVRRQLARDWRVGDLDRLYRTFDITLAVRGQVAGDGQVTRLELELVDPTSGRTLRTTTVEALPGNLTSLQVEPALRLTALLELELPEGMRSTLDAGGTNVTGAFELYLGGRGALGRAATIQQVDEAVTLLESAVTADPAFPAARVALAQARLERFDLTGDPADITAGLRQAASVPADAQHTAAALRVTGALHHAAGRGGEAALALEQAIAADPWDAELQVELARVQRALGHDDAAARSLRTAIYLRPGYWPDRYWLAAHHLGQGRYAEAATLFREIIQLAPRHTGGYNNLGAVYVFLGRRDEAQRLFERSLEVNGEDNYVACSNLGTLYFEASRFADAQAMFERAVALDDSDYEVWGNLAQAYGAGPEPARSEEPFRRAIALALAQLPGDARLLANLASYHAGIGDVAAGLDYLDRAARAGTDDPVVVANIAEAYEDLGQRELALEWVRRAFETGARPARFEGRPSLRALIADERYRQLVTDTKD